MRDWKRLFALGPVVLDYLWSPAPMGVRIDPIPNPPGSAVFNVKIRLFGFSVIFSIDHGA